jgi:hypothetical protein
MKMRTHLQKQSLLWGTVLILLGAVSLLGEFIDIPPLGWAFTFIVAGFIPLIVYWQERSNWAYFIPSYVFWVIAGLIVLTTWDVLSGEGIALYVLWVIAIPFLIAFLRDQTNWGLLIPAYVLFAVGIMVFLIGMGVLDDLLIPAYVMISIALPFLLVYLRNPKNWWALIPAGIMGVIAAGFLLATPAVRYIVPAVLLIVGIWIIWRQIRIK